MPESIQNNTPLSMNKQGIDEYDEISLASYAGVLIENYRTIICSILILVLLATAYAFLATPIYKADALIQVEENSGSMSSLSELDNLLGTDAPTEAEIEIIRSRSVLGKVIEKLQLDILVKPYYFPVIGSWLVRRHQEESLASTLWGMKNYAWGGEKLQVDTLLLPKSFEDKSLTLVATRKDGHYKLLDADGALLLEGDVGMLIKKSGVSIFVSELMAHPETQFHVTKRSWISAIKALQKNLKVSEKGKKTGMLLMVLQSSDPFYAVAVLNAMADTYLRQNVEHKSEEAHQALLFLQGQLPDIKVELDSAEAKLNAFRLDKGSLDVGLEVRSMLEQAVELEQQLSETKMKKIELERKFTVNHPILKALDAQLSRLNTEKVALNRRIKALPETEQEVLRLMRDVKVQTELYTLLLNKVQELKVAKAGTIGNVRIIDYAILPSEPIKPKKILVIVFGLILGLFIGIVIVFIRKSMERGIEHPDIIEKQLGIPVYATVPHAKAQEKLFERMKKNKGKGGDYLLASAEGTDLAIESLRSLRTNLRFGLIEAKNNIVMISGVAPGVGKSFVSANLSHVLAKVGIRVLLVDADLRKGHLHEYFSVENSHGLSECICGDVSLTEAIISTKYDSLDVLLSGSYPPDPSELLMSHRFENLLQEASKKYDLVLIDTPPVLAVTDAVIIGKLAGATFFLLRAGQHPIQEIQQAIRRLENGGVKLKGFVFNGIRPARSSYGYGYGYGYGSYQYK